MRRYLVLFICLTVTGGAWSFNNISDTVHNLSISGPGPYKSQTETAICIFCHTPHRHSGDTPSWNRQLGSGYTPYQSTTAQALTGDTAGSSTLCLSCHDGTIALGDLISNQWISGGQEDNLRSTLMTGRARLGTDLSNDHPVAIVYSSSLAAADTNLVNPVGLDLPLENGSIQCVSCHDAHSNAIPPFLRRTTANGDLCLSCHSHSGARWDWASSSHALSNAGPGAADPWPERKSEWKGANVSENSCMNCHTPHNAATPARLVVDTEEDTCFRCHDGTVARHDIRSDTLKFFRHPVEQTPNIDHDAMLQENPLSMPLHVECEDCHNPHASRSDTPMISFNPSSPMDSGHSVAPFANKTIAGVSGIGSDGSFRAEVQYEYEMCFKCHGVPGKNACNNRRCPTPRTYDLVRQDGVYNIRDKVDPGNPSLQSYHPLVENDPSNNSEVPSLRTDTPLSTLTSLIFCSDCHSSDSSPAAGSVGPSGPHGSVYEGLVAQRYDFNPQSPFGGSPTSLCFKCHDSGSLFSDVSFPHRKHVLKENTSCINCHDPHGSAVYPHLLNFLTRANVAGRTWSITGAGGYSEPTWRDDGEFSGTCWMSCHGEEHDGESYP